MKVSGSYVSVSGLSRLGIPPRDIGIAHHKRCVAIRTASEADATRYDVCEARIGAAEHVCQRVFFAVASSRDALLDVMHADNAIHSSSSNPRARSHRTRAVHSQDKAR